MDRITAYFVEARWRQPEMLLLLMAAAVPISFGTWSALLNNFAIERAAFTGAEMGILQSLREIPGFLAFAAVWLLLLMREQTLALVALALLGIGTAITGYFPFVVGLYATTVLSSIGFHYYETMQTSLTMQWIDKRRAPLVFGRIIAVGGFTSLLTFALVYGAADILGFDFPAIYLLGGGVTVAFAVVAWLAWPRIGSHVEQHKHLVLRRRYWLYYALNFTAGARRQIFIVFAGFLMVEKFGYTVAEISLLFLINCAINMVLAPQVGRLIGRWGERRALTFEYIGLIGVFTAYAFVENASWAAALYVIDHLFFALAIAMRTYFQKIADPADIAPTAGVAFSINHITSVVIPVVFGFVWLSSPAAVFLAGSAIAVASLVLALLVPHDPKPGNETILPRRVPASAVAAE
jgi:hypothetical protein